MEKKTKILIVEDEQVTALTIKKMLEPGYEVVGVVSTGEEALDKAEEHQPDLVLMDIVLEDEMNGIQVTEIITSRFDIPVVYITAYSDEETLSRAKITNPYGYLVKPISGRELHVAIEIAIHNHRMEKKLKESEERFRNLANLLPQGVFETDLEGRIIFSNLKSLENSGYTQEDFENGVYISQLFLPEEVERVNKNFQEVLSGETIEGNEYIALRKDGTTYPVEVTSSPIIRDEQVVGVRGIVIDITKRKQEEESLKRKLMKFDLKKGKIYLTVEKSPFRALEALKDLRNVGYKGSVISRSSMKDLNLQSDEDLTYYWLSETEIASESDNIAYLLPDLPVIEKNIENTSQKSVILLDSLDFLVVKNGFEETLDFVHRLRQLAYLKQIVVILSLDHQTVKDQQLNLLKKEVPQIKPINPQLHENALKVLEFTFKQNSRGVKPSCTEISQGLGITRQSASKWMKNLTSKGYLREERMGRSKTVEVTKKGSYLLRKR